MPVVEAVASGPATASVLVIVLSLVAAATVVALLVQRVQLREAVDARVAAERAADQARADRAEAKDERRRLERALLVITAGVVVADERGDIIFRNDAAAEFARARHGEALVEAAVRELVAAAIEEGAVGERTVELFGPPRRTLVVSARPLLRNGSSVGALAVIDDLTERRRLEAVRRDFVANISHELKTPVGALSLLAETLVDEGDPQVSRRLAERMVTESMRLANTIDDLLVLSRIEAEDVPEHEPVFIHAVVKESVERIQPAAEQASITITGPSDDQRAAVMGDRRQLVSALSNLLDNAVKYSDPGSAVDIEVAVEGDAVELTVADHGIGIPARDLERVFERFYRVDLARSRQTGGTGLGLSIVRHVVENHHGEVRLESRLGEGSRFTLRLPLLAAGPVAVADRPASDGPDAERDAG